MLVSFLRYKLSIINMPQLGNVFYISFYACLSQIEGLCQIREI